MASGLDKAMGLGLRVIGRIAALPLIDRMGLRKRVEKAVYHGARAGFRTAGKAGRTFKAAQKLVRPARLPRGGSRELFSLEPSEEQQMLREAVARFAAERLRPAAAAADTACAAPPELLAECGELGIGLMGVPEELGGAGAERSAVTNVLVAQALAHGDLALTVACLAPSAVSTALVLWGDEAQQAKYLPAFTGESAPVAALAVQEPRVLFDPLQLQAKARRVDGGYVIDGVKSQVVRGADAELFVIAADIDNRGPGLLIVEASTVGVTLESEPAMGLRAAATARLHLKDVRVGEDALLGDAAAYRECIALSRLAWCALALGTGTAVQDYVIPYVNERVAFGEPIGNRQGVAFVVANIAIELEGMRLLAYRAASRIDQGLDAAREIALARRACATRGMGLGNDGVQLLGGHGFVKEHPVERWYRDLRAVGVMEGVLLV